MAVRSKWKTFIYTYVYIIYIYIYNIYIYIHIKYIYIFIYIYLYTYIFNTYTICVIYTLKTRDDIVIFNVDKEVAVVILDAKDS